jgi:hypothetical protein
MAVTPRCARHAAIKRWEFFFVDMYGKEVAVLARALVSPTTEQILQTIQEDDGYLNRYQSGRTADRPPANEGGNSHDACIGTTF